MRPTWASSTHSAREGGTVARRQSDLLEDVSVASRVVDLEFTVGQVCKIAGITKMQLDYWTVRGDIPTLGKKQRLYDSHAVEFVMLIKQARDLGFDVNAAIAAAKEYQGIRDTQRSDEQISRAA
jgi:hypothetical protein